MRNGVIAGSIAAIVVALVSLPLRSPADNVFNTATVGLASLLVGIAANLLWDRLAGNQRRPVYHVGAMALGLTAVVVIVGFLAVLAGLVGLFSEQATEKLKIIAQSVFVEPEYETAVEGSNKDGQ